MKKTKIIKTSIICSVMAFAAMMPLGHQVNATLPDAQVAYQAYPTPSEKPAINACQTKTAEDNSYISDRQAAVAALGLYLGIKRATAPQEQNKPTYSTCV